MKTLTRNVFGGLAVAALILAVTVDANAQTQRRTTTQQHRVVDPDAGRQSPTLGVTGRIYQNWGFKVDSVVYGSPAQQMGLERGDVILRVNGTKITSVHALKRALRYARDYQGGHVDAVVDNVRARLGQNVQRIVHAHAKLPASYPSVTVYNKY